MILKLLKCLTTSGLDERVTEGDNFVLGIESNVSNSIGNGDAVDFLLDIGMANTVDGAGGTNVNVVIGHTELLGNESDGSILDGSVGTLRQSVVNTSTESLFIRYVSLERLTSYSDVKVHTS